MQANSEYPRSNVTMRGLIGRYIEEVVRPSLNVPIGGEPDDDARLAYASAIAYESQIRNHIQPAWEKYPVRDFEKPEVQALVENWLRSLRRSPNRPNGLAPQSLAHIRGVMHAIFKFAVKWGYLRFNPLSDKTVELPRGCSKRLKPPVQINPSQFLSLIDNLHIREKAAVSLDGWLGTRVGEPFGLKWEDLDLHAGTVNFSRGFSQGRVTHLKTEASRANLPLPDDVVEVLRQWSEKTPYKRPGDWVFASPFCGGKRPFSPRTLMNHIQPVARALGLPHIGWHTLRHSFCASAKAAGLQIEDVKTLTRHHTTKMPSEVYGRPEIETTRVHQNRVIAHMKKQAKKSKSKERKARRLEVNGLTLI